ncbi:T9SS C-terminal target domain-containing protein [candidate division KSB1 bacterium]|nr:carboxypeptidase regulatory-like domain-containing protein [candidate division KSB1 bacterium]RQW03149.1 MAG: T9SS C-terminal target domain-containing protein [candidate division KSB1 bacterium]
MMEKSVRIFILVMLGVCLMTGAAFSLQFEGRVYEGSVGDESTPIPNVTVRLYGSQDANYLGIEIISTTTDAKGWYGLQIREGYEFYNIVEEDPSGYTSVGATSVDGKVINANQIQYSVVEKPLQDQTLTGNKFWDRKPASSGIGDWVWDDLNGNGIQDNGEPGHAGVRVELLDSNKNSLATTTTDASGVYKFSDLQAGQYYVRFYKPGGYEFTAANIGSDDSRDSDADPSTGETSFISVPDNKFDKTIDAGLIEEQEEERDYGDAPDPSYPTLLKNNGASHIIVQGLYLGVHVDSEPDGQPNADATGDDTGGHDDEDGIVFLNDLVPGAYTGFAATASAKGNLGVWVDFNGNGSWADGEESIFNHDTTVFAGANTWSFFVPPGAKPGKTMARFRYSRTYGLTYDGPWPDGEVEDYQVEIKRETDLGSITIRKQAYPADNTPFEFTGDFGPFNLKYPSDSTITFAGVKPGKYRFKETIPSGWKLDKIDVNDPDGSSSSDVSAATAYVQVDANEHILVTFINSKEGEREQDFGDAQDPSYPTLLKSNGARHLIDQAVYLGATIDSEPDGQPDAAALGDDNNGHDDEDGIVFLNDLVTDAYTSFVATASVKGNLGVWVDFNGNGSWADPGESVFNHDTTVFAGANTWGFYVPPGAKPGRSVARFRYSTTSGLKYEGFWPDGEVEDYLVEIKQETDLGSVTIRKQAHPADNTPFDFGGSFGPFTLKYPSDSTITFAGVKPGKYSFKEVIPSGWKLDAIDVKDPDGSSSVNVSAASAYVQVDGNEHILVTFINSKEDGRELDFGDAPDPRYPTLLVNNGARHVIIPKFFLGSGIDAEPDGTPTPLADGDDTNGFDDEDGVIMSPFIAPGQTVPITVHASAAGALNAWIDFNGDGDWSDAGEHFIAAQPVNAGANSFTLNVPANAKMGVSYLRFRFSSVRQLSYDGIAPDGEVEDYIVEITEKEDGSIKIIKDANPKDDTPFLICLQFSSGFFQTLCTNLKDPSQNQLIILNPSQVIDVTESVAPGWILQDIVISGDADNGSTVDLPNGKVSLDFDPGENIVIVFKNDRHGIPPIKWPQPPKKKKDSPHPDCFWGWDEPSIYARVIAADDWYSSDERPITDIHWWGSYQEWLEKTPPANAPERFHIGIWTDVPVGPNEPWSHPGTMIWEIVVDRGALNEHWVGCDFYPQKMQEPESCFKYDFLLPPANWFNCQANTIYWISIAAVYSSPPNNFPWGWKTVEHYFQDDAVSMTMPKTPVIGDIFQAGQPIGEGWDLAYILTTDQPTEEYDFGDAPDDPNSTIYPTLHVNGGAYHTINPGFFLGAGIDADIDGQPDGDAMGDDNDGNDDEDGVGFPFTMNIGQTVTIVVTASNKGLLNVWIDYNQNKDWSDAGEHIFIDEPVNPGANNLTFTIPPGAQEGYTFARFRLSRQQGLSFAGWGGEGEVEDYKIYLHEEEGEPALKWSQPPLKSRDPDFPFPHLFWGWDEVSILDKVVLADDWFCRDPRPVTGFRWWGSYTQWDKPEPPEHAPIGFHFGIWSDVPKGENRDWSHPGELIWARAVDRSGVHEHVVGGDFMPGDMEKPDSCFAYFYEIPKPDWFYQEKDSTVYWLSIAAIYEEMPEEHYWGWKVRERYFNDCGVFIFEPKDLIPGTLFKEGEPLGEMWDMTFELLTIDYDRQFDFGDAPEPMYQSLFETNGAHHFIDPDVYLGSRIDKEVNGQPEPDALGDDNNGIDDDDGVQFVSSLQPTQMAQVKITASTHGFLNAWIDFNQSNDWSDENEQIFSDVELAPGSHTLDFKVIDDAKAGPTFARFRFSTVPGLHFRGLAFDGEVEDYKVKIDTLSTVRSSAESIPAEYLLHQNYPNPFNPTTDIRYDVPRQSHVQLIIYDLRGRVIRRLLDETKNPGRFSIVWDGQDDSGQVMPSGVYIYSITADQYKSTRKLVLVK